MLAVEVGSALAIVYQKELAAVGVGTSVGHRNNACVVDERVVLAFVFELIAGATHARAGRVAALCHKVGNHPVEGDVVVVAFFGQKDKIIDGLGGCRWVEFEDDFALRGAHCSDVLFGNIDGHLGRALPLFVIGHGWFLSYTFLLYYTQVPQHTPSAAHQMGVVF